MIRAGGAPGQTPGCESQPDQRRLGANGQQLCVPIVEEDVMTDLLKDIRATNGDPVAPDDIAAAVTAGRLVYADGASQVFEPTGATTYL